MASFTNSYSSTPHSTYFVTSTTTYQIAPCSSPSTTSNHLSSHSTMGFLKEAPSALSSSYYTSLIYYHPHMTTKFTIPNLQTAFATSRPPIIHDSSDNNSKTPSTKSQHGIYRIGLNADKTAQLFFHGKCRTSQKPTTHITINNTNIPIHNKAKFLGVTCDSSLSFKTHIKQIESKAKHRIIRLHSIYNQTYGR